MPTPSTSSKPPPVQLGPQLGLQQGQKPGLRHSSTQGPQAGPQQGPQAGPQEGGGGARCTIYSPTSIFFIESVLAFLVLLLAIAMLIKEQDKSSVYAQRAWYIFASILACVHFLFQILLLVGVYKGNDAYILIWIVWNGIFATFLLGHAINLPFKYFSQATHSRDTATGILIVLIAILFLLGFCVQLFCLRIIFIRWQLMRRKQQEELLEAQRLAAIANAVPTKTSIQKASNAGRTEVPVGKSEVVPPVSKSVVPIGKSEANPKANYPPAPKPKTEAEPRMGGGKTINDS